MKELGTNYERRPLKISQSRVEETVNIYRPRKNMVAGFRQQPNGCVLAVVEPESGAEGVVATKPERVPSSSTRHSPPARQAAIRQSGGNRRGAAWRQRARDCELVVAHALDRLVARLEELLSAAVQQLLEQLIRKLLDKPPRLRHAAAL